MVQNFEVLIYSLESKSVEKVKCLKRIIGVIDRYKEKKTKKTGGLVSFEDETFVRGEGCNDQEIHHKSRMGLGSSQSKSYPISIEKK